MNLDPKLLLAAYCQGIFPMADEHGVINWYDADPRAILPLDRVHIPRRLARTVRNGPFEIRVDSAFRQVMQACAEPAPGREESWIAPQMVAAYTGLHQLGFAHSVETWVDGELVGGLYGVSVRGLFAGESMFSRQRDASKVALVHLVERLRRGGFVLLDCQMVTNMTAQFGAIEVSRQTYQTLLAQALRVNAVF